jgi:hypothetical protein
MQQGSSASYEVTGKNTEWDDILIKKGIRTQDEIYMEKGLNPLDVRRIFYIVSKSHCDAHLVYIIM